MAAARFRDQRPALLHGGGQRLLGEHMLAGGQRRHADAVMRVGHGQIEDEVHILGRQQGLHGLDPNAVLGGALLRQIGR